MGKEKISDKDKRLHFVVCLAASIVATPLFAAGLAIGKEYGDSRAPGNHWCWLDLIADAAGVMIGAVPWAWLMWG